MAVILSEEPNAVVTRLPEVRFVLRLTSAGTYPSLRWMFYRLKVDGVYIQYNLNLANAVGINVPIDASEMLKPFVSIPYPGLSGTDNQSVLESTADVVLTYGELEYNVDTEVTSVISSTDSSTIKVFDGASQFTDYVFDPSAPTQIVLSRRPTRISSSINEHDWMYVMVSNTQIAVFSVRLFDKQGVQIGFASSLLAAGSIGYIPIGGANMWSDAAGATDPKTWGYAQVQFTGIVNWQFDVYRIYFDRVPCERETAELHFKEPIGGWSGMSFDTISRSSKRSASVATSPYQWGATPADNLNINSGGRRVARLQATESVTLKRKFDRRQAADYKDYLKSLCASERVGIKMDLPNGDTEFVPGIIVKDNLDTYKPENTFEFEVQVDLFKDIISA